MVFRWFMLCRALVVILAMSPAALPETSLAYDIKPKTPESAFAAFRKISAGVPSGNRLTVA